MCWRLSKLSEEGKMTHAMASNVKAWTTAQVVEYHVPHVCALCLLCLPQIDRMEPDAALRLKL